MALQQGLCTGHDKEHDSGFRVAFHCGQGSGKKPVLGNLRKIWSKIFKGTARSDSSYRLDG